MTTHAFGTPDESPCHQPEKVVLEALVVPDVEHDVNRRVGHQQEMAALEKKKCSE